MHDDVCDMYIDYSSKCRYDPFSEKAQYDRSRFSCKVARCRR